MTSFSRNTNLWKLRLYFALYIGGGGFLSPFLPLFYKHVGLTGAQMGLLTSLGWTIAMLLAPFWGRWSDAAKSPKLVLQIALVGTGIAYILVGFQTTFLWIAVCIALGAVFNNSIGSLSTTHALAAADGEKSGFGSIRLFGSLGWAIITPLAGWLIGQWGLLVPFAGYAAAIIGSALIIQFVTTNLRSTKRNLTQPRVPLRQVVKSLAKDRFMIGLAAAMFIFWFTGIGRSQFEPIYLTQLGASTGLVGVVNAIGAVIELPSMLWSDRLVHRYGASAVLRASMILQAFGLSAAVAAPSVVSIFLFRAVQGVSFSMLTVAMVTYIIERAPHEQDATALTFYDVTLRGLVTLIVSPFSGLLFDLVGAYWLFVLALAGNLISWLILSVTVRPPKVTRDTMISS